MIEIVKDKKNEPPSEQAILAEVVRQVLGAYMIRPMVDEVKEAVSKIETQWDAAYTPMKQMMDGKLSQCPECGMSAFAGSMCEGECFVCPTCGSMLKWTLKEKTGRYTLVNPE